MQLMHGSVPSAPGQPPGQVQPLGPGERGNCLKRSCPEGRGVGQIKNIFSLILGFDFSKYVLLLARFT